MKEEYLPADGGKDEPEEIARGSDEQSCKNRDDIPGIMVEDGDRRLGKVATRNFVNPSLSLPHEIDPRSPVSDHFKAALHRIDGITMYIAVAIYLITAMVFLLRIILLDAHTKRDEMIFAGSLCMVIATILLYFKYHITLVIENMELKRLVIAMLLLGMLVYFFYLFFLK